MKGKKKKQGLELSQILVTVCVCGLFFYFAYHLMHGDRGYFALRGVEEKLVVQQVKYDQKMTERVALENRVRRLRPESLDLDMLDERARVVLGYGRAGEKILTGLN